MFLMFNSYIFILYVSLLSILTILLIYYKKNISDFFNLYDYPNYRKLHKKPISLINGLIILLNLNLYFIFDIFCFEMFPTKTAAIFLILTNVFYFMGYSDDLKNLSASLKTILIFISLIIILPLDSNLILESLKFKNLFNNEINLNEASLFITVFFIYIFYNFINFSDGANGISCSQMIFYLLILTINSEQLTFFNLYLIILLCICLLINILNLSFFGNSGISILSIIFSLIFIYDYNINQTLLCDEIFILFFLPGMDMARLTIERLISGKAIYAADLNHFHHLLSENLKSKNYLFLIYLIISAAPYGLSLIINSYLITILLSILLYFLLIFFLRRKKEV